MIIFDLLVAGRRHFRKKLINVYCFECTMRKISIIVKFHNNILFILLNEVNGNANSSKGARGFYVSTLIKIKRILQEIMLVYDENYIQSPLFFFK